MNKTQCLSLLGSHLGAEACEKHRQPLSGRGVGTGVRKAERGDLMGRFSHIAEKYQFNSVHDGES